MLHTKSIIHIGFSYVGNLLPSRDAVRIFWYKQREVAGSQYLFLKVLARPEYLPTKMHLVFAVKCLCAIPLHVLHVLRYDFKILYRHFISLRKILRVDKIPLLFDTGAVWPSTLLPTAQYRDIHFDRFHFSSI